MTKREFHEELVKFHEAGYNIVSIPRALPVSYHPDKTVDGPQKAIFILEDHTATLDKFGSAAGREGYNRQKDWFVMMATDFVIALENGACGGFIDALLGVLLYRQANIFRINDDTLAKYVDTKLMDALEDTDKLNELERIVLQRLAKEQMNDPDANKDTNERDERE